MFALPEPSEFARTLAGIADDLHDRFHTIDENDPPLSDEIETFWKILGPDFPGVETPWSAVFVSFCVKTAGATAAEFKFSAQHSVFVHRAIQNALAGTGVFRGVRITEDAVRVGDILQNNREGNRFDFDFARTHDDYKSHSRIIVSRGEDSMGKFAMAVGGNESDSIRRTRVLLNSDGSVRQRTTSPFICLIKDLK
jgi:hypothetical protein